MQTEQVTNRKEEMSRVSLSMKATMWSQKAPRRPSTELNKTAGSNRLFSNLKNGHSGAILLQYSLYNAVPRRIWIIPYGKDNINLSGGGVHGVKSYVMHA